MAERVKETVSVFMGPSSFREVERELLYWLIRLSRLSDEGSGDVVMVALSKAEKLWGRMDDMFLKVMEHFSFSIGVGRWILNNMVRW